MARLGLAVLLLLLGLVVGVAVVALHQSWLLLAVGCAALLAVMVALPTAWWSRPPFVAGYAVVVSLAMLPRGEGDYLIASDASGYTVIGTTLVLVIAAVVTLPRPEWRHERRRQLRHQPVE